MSIQTIPLTALKKIRQYVQRVLVVPESENHPKSAVSFDEVDELPEPESIDQLGDLFNIASPLDVASPLGVEMPAPNNEGRWFVSAVNPGAALMKLPGLQLKQGLRLVSYLYRMTDLGIGVTWAVPEAMSTTVELENALEGAVDDSNPPHPAGALANFMEAIEGDRTGQSFAIASILHREIQEFGRLGERCDWSHHRLIDAVPTQVAWQWKTQMPKDLRAKVRVLAERDVAVEFFTLRVRAPVAIYRHVDRYQASTYNAKSLDRPVAIPLQKKSN